jgi:hypothetical protein
VERQRRPQPRGGVAARSRCGPVIQRGEGADGRTWAKGSSRGLSQSFANTDSQRHSRSLSVRRASHEAQDEGKGFIAKAQPKICQHGLAKTRPKRCQGGGEFTKHRRRAGSSRERKSSVADITRRGVSSVQISSSYPSGTRRRQQVSSLRDSAEASPTTERCACIMRV